MIHTVIKLDKEPYIRHPACFVWSEGREYTSPLRQEESKVRAFWAFPAVAVPQH